MGYIAGGEHIRRVGLHIFVDHYPAFDVEIPGFSQVQARLDNFDTPVDVNSGILIRFVGGALATVSVVGHATQWSEEVQIFGSKGSLHYVNGRVYERLFDSAYVAEVVKLGATVTPARNFVDAIFGREPIHSPGSSAVRSVALTAAAFESARLHQPVRPVG